MTADLSEFAIFFSCFPRANMFKELLYHGFQQDYKCFQSHAAGISENLISISPTVVTLAIGNLSSFEPKLTFMAIEGLGTI